VSQSTATAVCRHWRHLANKIEFVHPSTHSSPQPKRQIDQLNFCTANGRKCLHAAALDLELVAVQSKVLMDGCDTPSVVFSPLCQPSVRFVHARTCVCQTGSTAKVERRRSSRNRQKATGNTVVLIYMLLCLTSFQQYLDNWTADPIALILRSCGTDIFC